MTFISGVSGRGKTLTLGEDRWCRRKDVRRKTFQLSITQTRHRYGGQEGKEEVIQEHTRGHIWDRGTK